MISVIIPIFKVEKYLARCLDSILTQTEENFELILVDDGSPDQCGRICDDYALKDSRITVIHKENGGLSDARNAGLAIAKGEYIAFVDSDDWVDAKYLENLLNGIKDADICECEIIRTDGTVIAERKDYVKRRLYSGREALSNLIDDHLFHQYVWNKLYRSEVIDGIMFETGKTNEDEFWTYQVFGNASRVAKIDDVLYYYFQRSESIMGSNYSLKRLDSLEAKKQRQRYLEKRFPELAVTGKRNILYSCTYAGQMTLKYLSSTEKKQAQRIIDAYRQEYKLNKDEIKAFPIYEKMWILLLNMSFWQGCRLRNLLKIGF